MEKISEDPEYVSTVTIMILEPLMCDDCLDKILPKIYRSQEEYELVTFIRNINISTFIPLLCDKCFLSLPL